MTPENDLDWLAFQYVAGELASDEVAAFEHRLDSDQSACEAVARAVELVEQLGTRPRVFPIRRVAMVVFAAAACLLLAVGSSFLNRSSRPETEGASVALTWSGLRQDAEVDRHELLTWLDDASDTTPTETDDESTDAPPTWLIDATSLPDAAPIVSPGS